MARTSARFVCFACTKVEPQLSDVGPANYGGEKVQATLQWLRKTTLYHSRQPIYGVDQNGKYIPTLKTICRYLHSEYRAILKLSAHLYCRRLRCGYKKFVKKTGLLDRRPDGPYQNRREILLILG